MKTKISKIAKLLDDCTPTSFENLFYCMIPAYIGSEQFESLETGSKNKEVHFLMDLWDLFSHDKADIIEAFPEFLSKFPDLEHNRNTLKTCFSVFTSCDDYCFAVGFDDAGFQTYGVMYLIDCFREPCKILETA